MELNTNIIIAGNGKLAHSLFAGLRDFKKIFFWSAFDKNIYEKSILIHTGSGRQLKECIDYCNKTDSILLELSTGLAIAPESVKCTLVECPNAAVPVLKLMNMIRENSRHFSKYRITILESHQQSKKTIAGTAYEIANDLNVSSDKIESVREKNRQLNQIGIPQEYLDLHAYHKIVIEEEGCEVKFEMKVLGHDAYVKGTKVIVNALLNGVFEKRIYSINELIKSGII